MQGRVVTGGPMPRIEVSSYFAKAALQWQRAVACVALFCMTIRGRILIAFLVMSMITAGLGGYATFGIKDAGLLVDKTYNGSLMSINYARAAATDFAAMRAAFTRMWIATDLKTRAELDTEIRSLTVTLGEDLQIAVQRSQSSRVKEAAANVEREVAAWTSMRERMLDNTKPTPTGTRST